MNDRLALHTCLTHDSSYINNFDLRVITFLAVVVVIVVVVADGWLLANWMLNGDRQLMWYRIMRLIRRLVDEPLWLNTAIIKVTKSATINTLIL
jgi:hypothetical protein